MKPIGWINVTVIFCLALAAPMQSCKSPEGPDFKEQVTHALELYYQGEDLERQDKFAQAAEKYAQSVEISPRPKAYFRLAYVSLQINQLEQARQAIEQSLELSPNYERAKRLQDQIQVRLTQTGGEPTMDTTPPAKTKDFPETPAEMQTAVKETTTRQEPQADTTFAGLVENAKEAQTAGNWQEAAGLYQQILETPQADASHYYNLGYAQFQMKQYEKAVDTFKKAIELKSDFADAYNDLGVALESMGRTADAIEAYQKAIDIENHGDAYFNLALLTEKRGNYKKAIALYEKYLQYDSESAYASYARERIDLLRRKAF